MDSVRNNTLLRCLILGFIAIAGYRWARISAHHGLNLPEIEIESQMAQLNELLPDSSRSVAWNIDLRDFIYDTLAEGLPAEYQSRTEAIARALISEANKYNLDPLFLLAVIKTESGFNPMAIGRHGEVGLMQLMPKTGYWMAHRLKTAGPLDLRDPVVNIKLGAEYLAHLRKHFDSKGSRYVAAYNMGIHNVHKLLKKDKEPIFYPKRVLKNYSELYEKLAGSIPSQTEIVAVN